MAPGLTSSWVLTAWLVLKELMPADRHGQLCLVPMECTASVCWIITEQGASSMLQSGPLQRVSSQLPSAGCDRAGQGGVAYSALLLSLRCAHSLLQETVLDKLTCADIWPECEGSDHCPVWADLDFTEELPRGHVAPALSSSFMQQGGVFAGHAAHATCNCC